MFATRSHAELEAERRRNSDHEQHVGPQQLFVAATGFMARTKALNAPATTRSATAAMRFTFEPS
jgi:hypothetical protein